MTDEIGEKRIGRPPLIRTAIGGVLMGTANLIPGVSGGTMILAMGLYNEFIDSVADVTALRFSGRRIVFLGVMGMFAVASIQLLASGILYLLFHYPTAMYALFIGLTLGGAPALGRAIGEIRPSAVLGGLVGFGLIVGLFLMRRGGGIPHNMGTDFLSGILAAVTMVLPGISGSYILLLLGKYDRIVGSIRDLGGLQWSIIIPVGVGVVIGIVLLSNVLKVLLRRCARATMGFLLGMLVGSVVGLWPFGREPSSEAIEARTIDELVAFAADNGLTVKATDDHAAVSSAILDGWASRDRSGDMTAGRIGRAAIMVIFGFGVTSALAARSRGIGSGGESSAKGCETRAAASTMPTVNDP